MFNLTFPPAHNVFHLLSGVVALWAGLGKSVDGPRRFDLIFGAAKYNLKLIDLPVRYCERTYGETNIQRWTHGWLLLRMVALAMRRIKFV